MCFYNNLSKLCETKKITISGLLSELNMSASNKQKWQNGATVNSAVLIKIADYFEVSVDYLLGRTDNPYISGNYINGDNSVQAVQNSSVTINQGQKEADQENQELLNLIQGLPLKKRAKVITFIYDTIESEK